MSTDRIMCFQIFCFQWLVPQQIVSLIEKKKLADGVVCVWNLQQLWHKISKKNLLS